MGATVATHAVVGHSPRRQRRLALVVALVVAAAFVVVPAAAGGSGVPAQASEAEGLFLVPLPIPETLTGDHIELTAAETDVQVLPGAPTRMWTFNGTFPGPIIRRPAGETTQVTVHNQLPAEVGSITLHNHGNHSAAEHDGQPEGADYVIEPGSQRTYTYDLVENGAPVRGKTQWYHDHSHHRTGRNVWMGLAGMFIIDDPREADLGLPSGEFDVPLMIADRRFDENNQLVDMFTAPSRPDAGTGQGHGAGWPPFDDVIGDRMLVNGAPEPYLEVEPRRYRFRILNSSNFRPINVRLSNGFPLTQIATEGGLLPKPVRRDAILLGPAERAEVVVDFAGMNGHTVTLESVPKDTGGRPATAAAVAPIMQLRVASTVTEPDTSRVPAQLSQLPDWVDDIPERPDRLWTFGLNPSPDESGHSSWTINGRSFDHTRIDARPEVDSVESWMLVNTTPLAVSHYVHLHHSDWVMVSRNGRAPEPWEAGLKETFRVDPGDVVVVARKFSDHLGPYMLHCHMLEHEDHGMMATFEVVPEGEGDVLPVGDLIGDGGVRPPGPPGAPPAPQLPDLPTPTGETTTVFANPGGSSSGYTPRTPISPAGNLVELTNLDQMDHDITSVERRADGRPLFASAFAAARETVPVVGTDTLPPGMYPFICSLHSAMTGELVVVEGGGAAVDLGGTTDHQHHHQEER